jgi:hypothetical protein
LFEGEGLDWHQRFSYSVSAKEIAEFVEGNVCVRDFLNRYEGNGASYVEKAVGLANLAPVDPALPILHLF